MLHDKQFQVNESNNTSRSYKIENGFQQGTVNSPILFSIYISDLLQMYDLNSDGKKAVIAFADDMVIYIKNNKPSVIKTELQQLFNKIQEYFHTWRLKINIKRCETILFRPYISRISNTNSDIKKFAIHDHKNPTNEVPQKKVVCYLGVYLDFKLNYNEHVKLQIDKAQKAFIANKRIFYSKDLDKEVKLLCYKLLFRPILIYGCPIWFNISASTTEKIRLFERKYPKPV